MPSKQVEDAYLARKSSNELSVQPLRQELSEKLAGYGQGIIHGWQTAADAVSEATNGLFTLQEPREISEWRARLKRSGRGGA